MKFLALAIVLAAGCAAERQIAVLGPGTPADYGLVGVWGGEKFSRAFAGDTPDHEHTFTALDARGFGLDGTWSLISYRAAEPTPPNRGIVLRSVRRLDGRAGGPPRLDDVLAAIDRQQLAELAAERAAVDALLPAAADATAKLPIASGSGRRTTRQVAAIEWLGDRLRVTVETSVTAMIMGRPCTGIEQPMQPLPAGSVTLRASYEVAARGRITRVAVQPLTQRGAPFCDPRIP